MNKNGEKRSFVNFLLWIVILCLCFVIGMFLYNEIVGQNKDSDSMDESVKLLSIQNQGTKDPGVLALLALENGNTKLYSYIAKTNTEIDSATALFLKSLSSYILKTNYNFITRPSSIPLVIVNDTFAFSYLPKQRANYYRNLAQFVAIKYWYKARYKALFGGFYHASDSKLFENLASLYSSTLSKEKIVGMLSLEFEIRYRSNRRSSFLSVKNEWNSTGLVELKEIVNEYKKTYRSVFVNNDSEQNLDSVLVWFDSLEKIIDKPITDANKKDVLASEKTLLSHIPTFER